MKNLFIILMLIIVPVISYSSDWKFSQELGNGGKIISLSSPDSLNAFALVQSNDTTYLYRSSDQGKNWNVLNTYQMSGDSIPYLINPTVGCSPDKTLYYMVYSDRACIRKSSDGGKSFEKIILAENYDDFTPIEIAMLDTNTGVILCMKPGALETYLFTTNDGWKTVTKLDTLISARLFSPVFYDNENVRMLSFFSNVKQPIMNFNIKTNEVKEFFDFNPNSDTSFHYFFNKLAYVNNSIGFIVGERVKTEKGAPTAVIFETIDGGKYWERVLDSVFSKSEIVFGLNDIAMHDKINGVATGVNLAIITNDGGATWKYDPSFHKDIRRGKDKDIFSAPEIITCWVGNTPVIATSGGNVYRYEGEYFKLITDSVLKLLYPENNSVSQSVSLTFTWSSVINNGTYVFKLSKDSNFIDIVASKYIDAAFHETSYDKMEHFTNYYWKAGIVNSSTDITWSDVFTFRTEMATPEVLSPECGSENQHTSLNIAWKPVMGAEHYVFRLSDEHLYDNILLSEEGLTNPQYSLSNLALGKTYYWWVRAYNENERSEWSSPCSFTTSWSNGVQKDIGNNEISVRNISDQLIISTDTHNKRYGRWRVELLDFYGNIASEADFNPSINGQITINLSKLATGAYFYRLIYSGETVKQGKLIIIR